MPKFYTAFDRPKSVPCPAGDEDYVSYIEAVDPVTGQKYLEESGRINIRDYILSTYEDTKIDNILARCTQGDLSALERMQGYYADITNVPKSIAEMHAFMENARNDFYNLPLEIREKFDNDPSQFILGFGDGRVLDVLSSYTKSPDNKVDEVAINE